jgi:hypothetical protein
MPNIRINKLVFLVSLSLAGASGGVANAQICAAQCDSDYSSCISDCDCPGCCDPDGYCYPSCIAACSRCVNRCDNQHRACISQVQTQFCGSHNCGTAIDSCGGTVFCGECSAGQTCYGGLCCTPLTPSQACGSRHCGTADDGCGRTLSCGVCGPHAYCGFDNQCYCEDGYYDCGTGMCVEICP